MSKEDLNSKLEELKKELLKVNAQRAVGTTPKNPGQIRQIKKNIARILTISHNKEEETESPKADKKKGGR